jgi:hypothetical protein
MDLLMELAPHHIQDMVRADDFQAFRDAACAQQLAVMQRLLQLSPHLIQDMVRANDYQAFYDAAEMNSVFFAVRIRKSAQMYR